MANEGLYRALGQSFRELNTIMTEQQVYSENQEFKAMQAERQDKILASQLQDAALNRKQLQLKAAQAEAEMALTTVYDPVGRMFTEEEAPWLFKPDKNGLVPMDHIRKHLSMNGTYTYDPASGQYLDEANNPRMVQKWKAREITSEIGGLMASHTDPVKGLNNIVTSSQQGIDAIDSEIKQLNKNKTPYTQLAAAKTAVALNTQRAQLVQAQAGAKAQMQDKLALYVAKGQNLEQVRSMLISQGADTKEVDYLIGRNDKKVANEQSLQEARIQSGAGTLVTIYNPTTKATRKIRIGKNVEEYTPPKGWTLSKPSTDTGKITTMQDLTVNQGNQAITKAFGTMSEEGIWVPRKEDRGKHDWAQNRYVKLVSEGKMSNNQAQREAINATKKMDRKLHETIAKKRKLYAKDKAKLKEELKKSAQTFQAQFGWLPRQYKIYLKD